MKISTAIVCVDDDPSVLDSLWIQLEHNFGNEHLIESAESGAEALEVIAHLSEQGIEVRLLVADWLMPHMSGGELLKLVHASYSNIPAIVLSGQADIDSIDSLMQAGVVKAFIMKPWDEAELVNAIRQELP